MSLAPDDGARKGRSRSRSRDRRSRTEYDTYEDVREPSFIYPDDEPEDRYKGHPEAQASGALPYPEEGGIYSMLPGDKALYTYDSQEPTYKTASPTAESRYHSSYDHKSTGGLLPGAFPDEEPRGKGKDESPRTYRTDHYDAYESRRDDKYDGRREDAHDTRREEEESKLKFLPQKYIRKFTSGGSSDPDKEGEHKERRTGKDRYDDDLAYGKPALPKRPPGQHEDLAYGKAQGVPSTSSAPSGSKMTSFGGTAAAAAAAAAATASSAVALVRRDHHKKDERDEKHEEHHEDGHDYKYDPKYYGQPDDKYNERDDEKYRERYDERYYDKRDEYRDERRDDKRSSKYIEEYVEDYVDERDEPDARRRADKRSSLYDGRDEERYAEEYADKYVEKYSGKYTEKEDVRYYDERDDRRAETRPSRYADERDDRRDETRPSRYADERDGRREETRPSRYADEGPERRPYIEEYDRRRYDDKDPLSPSAEASYAANVLTVEPGSRQKEKEKKEDKRESRRHHRDKSSSDMLTVETGHKRDKSKTRDRSRGREKSSGTDLLSVESSGHRKRSRSRAGSSSLTVDTARLSGLSLASAPASPLLESYHGTYQESSPMPSPLLLASKTGGGDLRTLEPLSPLGSDFEDGKKRGRRARFHDSDDIPVQLAQALKGNRRPDTTPLIELLPGLTHDQVMELRVKYKVIVKTGPERKGVNIAKHIRARLKDEDPLLMKACYSVALGMWESEAYWANFWYQGDKTRRELLIESLMGRTNYEVRQIKDAFSDKKYDNSLAKCMKTELKEDKFKKAVLMVLDERRMEEYDEHAHVLPLDYGLVDRDMAELRRAVRSEKGGETAMINIVVQRSDSHLREVLQEYERHYQSNFARDALKKSGNLVGELLAHILNGIINRPVRDALLLHHAITASRKDGLRRELLISRLVRYHWDQQHMRAVKLAYRERYGRNLPDAIREATTGEWGQFCLELCITRTPDDVRRFDKVAVSSY